MDETRVETIDEHFHTGDDDFGFKVRWKVQENEWGMRYRADVEVWRVASTDDEGNQWFTDADCHHTRDLALAEVYLDGHIKWDGCSQIDMGDHHRCNSFKEHSELLKYLWTRASELMSADFEW